MKMSPVLFLNRAMLDARVLVWLEELENLIHPPLPRDAMERHGRQGKRYPGVNLRTRDPGWSRVGRRAG
ncbi:MAG: hypothetical protein GY859_09910 [Desulfobacterales bacterium]|nr:hypothetical protein [Desulfobacterales bacterium]